MRGLIGRAAVVGVLAVCGAAGLAAAQDSARSGAWAADAGWARVHPSVLRALDSREVVKVWVYFTDKGYHAGPQMDAALTALEHTYDPHAVIRRRNRRIDPGLFDERDLPVAYRAAAESTGAQVHVESRWLNAVSARVTREQVARLATLACVSRIELVRGGRRTELADVERIDGGGYGAREFYGRSLAQLTQVNLVALHALGHTGAGVRIGVLDTGFRRDHAAFNAPGRPLVVVAERDFINNDGNAAVESGDAADQHHHGTLILGVLGAYKPEDLVGGAYDSHFILCKTEDVTSETPVEEDNYVAGLEFIEFHGGDVATSSLGYIDWYTQADLDGVTATTSIAVNVATANGVHCCTSAGNSGHDGDPATSTLGAPADALRVIACGAVNNAGDIASFSSSGPSADGRVKPELLARGVSTRTVWVDDTASYTSASGTSLSCPVVAAAVACLAGARPTWTADQMRAALTSTATDFVANGVFDPLYIRGYGIVNAAAALNAGPTGCGSADYDGDGDSGTDADIEAFFACLGGTCCPTCGTSDFDGDGDSGTDADIEAFFSVLGGGNC